jgi:ribose transport system substrate-binding protein
MNFKLKLTMAAFALSAASMGTTASAEGVDELNPETVEQLYNPDMLDPAQPIGPSPLRDFVAQNPPPWNIGYASSYAGNTWRADVMDELMNKIAPEWRELGLLDEVLVTESNLNDTVQIQQIRQLADQGVDAIIICCSNPTALTQSIMYAYNKGIPVFSFVGYQSADVVLNSSPNFQINGFAVGKAAAEELGGKGKVLVVEGVPGTSTSDSQDRGIKAGLTEGTEIEIVDTIAGMWTDQVAQGELQKWLATHPGHIDAVVGQSSMEMGLLRAVKQSGRDIKVSIGGELGALCSWRKNPELTDAAVQTWPPRDEFQVVWHLMMRTLQGQGPKVRSVLRAPVTLTYDEMAEVVPEDCDENSQSWMSVGYERWGGDLDQFFVNPADPRAYKP